MYPVIQRETADLYLPHQNSVTAKSLMERSSAFQTTHTHRHIQHWNYELHYIAYFLIYDGQSIKLTNQSVIV
jgi:hypothetical protein